MTIVSVTLSIMGGYAMLLPMLYLLGGVNLVQSMFLFCLLISIVSGVLETLKGDL